MKAALAQIECVWGDADRNIAKIADWTERARAAGAQLLVFPELSGQPHPALRFEGPSFAVGRGGGILAETKDGAEQMLLVEVA